jgi:carboxylesterase type B
MPRHSGKYLTLLTRVSSNPSSPPPVSPVGAINREFSFIQHSLPVPEVPNHSDTDGLNLNITLPLRKDGTTYTNLPVYVFIHGGGFAVGSSWYPHYDPTSLVKLSVEKGKPIIGITIK